MRTNLEGHSWGEVVRKGQGAWGDEAQSLSLSLKEGYTLPLIFWA